jgi:hypothetical protein
MMHGLNRNGAASRFALLYLCGALGNACASDDDATGGSAPSLNAGTDGAAGMSAGMNGGAGTDGAAGMSAGTNGGAGTSGGAGMNGNTAGSGSGGDEPFVPEGEPLSAPDMTWTWVDFPDTRCRDGSTAGINLNLNSASDKVMIFLQGGGACFDFITCLANPANAAAMRGAQNGGVFDRNNMQNPVRDWNFVFVPYCTGDVHLGTNENGMVQGVAGAQKFVGRLNMEKYLHRIVPTFPNASQVLLTGVSAGGFGAAASAELVQWAFGDVPVNAIDDSGPPMSSEFLPACLQGRWRTLWGFDESFLKQCGDDCPNPDDFSIDYSLHVARKFPNALGGLIETTSDSVISLFYGYGANDCMPPSSPVPPETFRAGLLDYRERISAVTDKLGTYFITGSGHTWIAGNGFYTQEVSGVRMVDWFADIVNGVGTSHVGP